MNEKRQQIMKWLEVLNALLKVVEQAVSLIVAAKAIM